MRRHLKNRIWREKQCKNGSAHWICLSLEPSPILPQSDCDKAASERRDKADGFAIWLVWHSCNDGDHHLWFIAGFLTCTFMERSGENSTYQVKQSDSGWGRRPRLSSSATIHGDNPPHYLFQPADYIDGKSTKLPTRKSSLIKQPTGSSGATVLPTNSWRFPLKASQPATFTFQTHLLPFLR